VARRQESYWPQIHYSESYIIKHSLYDSQMNVSIFSVGMAYRKSPEAVERNSSSWSRNLVSFEDSVKKRKEVPLVESRLSDRCKMPKEFVLLGRYLYLARNIKSSNARSKEIVDEIKDLWQNFSFPCQTE